jgi:hypothetical protein
VAFGLPLVEAHGIAALFIAHALWMAGFALILGATLRPLEVPVEDNLSMQRILRDHVNIYKSPYIAAPALGWMFCTFCFLAVLTVLPPFIEAERRAWVLGAMPLASILVSMTLGVLALRYLNAVTVLQAGFLLGIAALLWLLEAPGDPTACIALAGAFGLMQGASFASVPELNTTAAHQSQANGAVAQTGNLGNTLGTPVLLAVLATAGYPGLIWALIAALAGGFGVHAWMAARRAR